MKRLTYQWTSRTHPKPDASESYDSFDVWGTDGDTTPQQKLHLPLVIGETDEQQRERIRQALGRKDVHWW